MCVKLLDGSIAHLGDHGFDLIQIRGNEQREGVLMNKVNEMKTAAPYYFAMAKCRGSIPQFASRRRYYGANMFPLRVWADGGGTADPAQVKSMQ